LGEGGPAQALRHRPHDTSNRMRRLRPHRRRAPALTRARGVPGYMSAVPSLLALRPVSTVHRLEARSEACPLSLRHLAGALAAAGVTMPIFAAPFPAVARAALVAAKEARAVVGLSLPARVEPE